MWFWWGAVFLLAIPVVVAVLVAGPLLEPAVITGVVREEGDGWVWRFGHELVRETIVAGLTRSQRARLHRRIAELALDLGGRGLDTRFLRGRHLRRGECRGGGGGQ